jgi:hypothetical protein
VPDEFEDPSSAAGGDPAARNYDGGDDDGDPRLRLAEAQLLGLPGVEGVGLGRSESGAEAIIVYVSAADMAFRLPSDVAGMPVVIQHSGPINAY